MSLRALNRAGPFHSSLKLQLHVWPLPVQRRCLTLKPPRPPQLNNPPRPSTWSNYYKVTKRLAVLSALCTISALYYSIQSLNNPSGQEQADPSKKTLVILGTGWGSVSLLKDLDTSQYNVVVVSPRDYFLFTPLLPSSVTGILNKQSLMEPIHFLLRHKKTAVKFVEGSATKVDHEKKVVQISSQSKTDDQKTTHDLPFDLLVVGVGAETTTFGIPGVQDHACFLKEAGDSQEIRHRLMKLIQNASREEITDEERQRLLRIVVVGGGPTGVELAAEIQDLFAHDVKKWLPHLDGQVRISLIEALPSILPMFSKKLIDYTEANLTEQSIDVRTRTMVKKVTADYVEVEIRSQDDQISLEKIPYGLMVWAAGIGPRPLVKELMSRIPEQASSRRGLLVDDYMQVKGTQCIWALGDCAVTSNAPTAQVAHQQGKYLAEQLNHRANEMESQETHSEAASGRSLKRFQYSHQGALAYIGNENAIADLRLFGMDIPSGGSWTMVLWRLAYIKMCLSVQNQALVIGDWLRTSTFGRDMWKE